MVYFWIVKVVNDRVRVGSGTEEADRGFVELFQIVFKRHIEFAFVVDWLDLASQLRSP